MRESTPASSDHFYQIYMYYPSSHDLKYTAQLSCFVFFPRQGSPASCQRCGVGQAVKASRGSFLPAAVAKALSFIEAQSLSASFIMVDNLTVEQIGAYQVFLNIVLQSKAKGCYLWCCFHFHST